MHYSNIVIIEKPEEITKEAIESAVATMMESGYEDWWDWYQIGGRWTGWLDGYDPEKDPQYLVECVWCKGTGKRPDMAVTDSCNACQGKGKQMKWPTDFQFRPGDTLPVEQLTEKHLQVHRIVLEGWGVFECEHYRPWNKAEPFTKLELPPLEWLKEHAEGMLAVIVDNHN